MDPEPQAEAVEPSGQMRTAGADELLLERVSRRAVLADVGVMVLFLGLAHAVTRAWAFAYVWRHPGPLDYLRAWELPWVVAGAVALLLVVFQTRQAGVSARAVGLCRESMSGQICWGILGAAVAFGTLLLCVRVRVVLHNALHGAGFPTPWLLQRGPGYAEAVRDVGVATVLITTGILAVFEEACFRGIILPRLRRLTGRWWSAVGICSLLFGAHHLAGGFATVVEAATISIMLCIVFIRSRSLVAVALAHFGCNIMLYGYQNWQS